MKQTAVEWLEDNIERGMDYLEILYLIKHAKAMEKEQMKDLYTMHMVDTRTMELYDFDEYYNETFKSE